MQVPVDVICKVCKKIFCCADCRSKHEKKRHAIIAQKQRNEMVCDKEGGATSEMAIGTSTIYLFCAICEERPMALHEEMYAEMLEHIEKHHLPLHCRKCAKVYTKIDDLKSFSKCLQPLKSCREEEEEGDLAVDRTCDTDASKVTVRRAAVSRTTISTQTSPRPVFSQSGQISDLTPVPIINLRWKAKTKIGHEEFICDSVSSIKNMSSISNSSSQRSVCVGASKVKGKLVRSTSTPVQAELYFSKPKEPAFNGSGGHVSSIYSSACDVDISPPVLNPTGASPKQSLDNINRYRKVGSGRSKLAAVTPLRQVMSKSIQKAIAEHGMPSATGAVSSPLDLRLSPALRRTQSELNYSTHSELGDLVPSKCKQIRREILMSSKKLTTESIVITRTHQQLSSGSGSGSLSASINPIKHISTDITTEEQSASTSSTSIGKSVYKTCRCVEIITSTELSEMSAVIQQNVYHKGSSTEEQHLKLAVSQAPIGGNNVAIITPITRIPGAVINKKVIKFETPKLEMTAEIDMHKNLPDASLGDLYFTPSATPMRKSSFQQSSNGNAECCDVGEHKKAVPRSLSDHFSPRSPRARPTLRQCVQTAVDRIENVSTDGDEDNENDDVFLLSKGKSTVLRREHPKMPQNALPVAQRRSWSLSTLLSSVMQLPVLKSSTRKKHNTISADADAGGNSIMRRCASLAGSLVRSKPLMDEAQLQSLKRKRTYTMDQQYVYNATKLNSNEAGLPNSAGVSTKRFRIQGRQPIERMRSYTQH